MEDSSCRLLTLTKTEDVLRIKPKEKLLYFSIRLITTFNSCDVAYFHYVVDDSGFKLAKLAKISKTDSNVVALAEIFVNP